MKRKFLSLACALALMLTLFAAPTSAAEQVVGYDYDCIVVDGLNYHFNLGVVTASASTTGESTGLREMTCSMYTVTPSGVHHGGDTSVMVLSVSISGYGEISTSQSTCSVKGGGRVATLVV